MSRTVPNSPTDALDPAEGPPRAVRITRDLYMAAARRLVSRANADIDAAARRLLESAPRHAIDFSLCFGTLDAAPTRRAQRVRQACLAVPGAGRTAMMFISEPADRPIEGSRGIAERAACISAACRHLTLEHASRVGLAQALPEPDEPWAIEAFEASGFLHVGTLVYLRAENSTPKDPEPQWPAGVSLQRVSETGVLGSDTDRARAERDLAAALEASYEDTLDCPELCGMRTPADVLDSHRSTGVYDPAWWWLVRVENHPVGAMFLSRCPEQQSMELVYLGLAPQARGKKLGGALLAMGMARIAQAYPGWDVTCAVDARNTPALALYAKLGFLPYAKRVAMVKSLAHSP